MCKQIEIVCLLNVLLPIPLNKLPWSLGNSEKNRYSQNGQKSIALDVYYLSMADFIVCTFSSNVCRLAYALRLLKIIKFINKFMKSYFFPFFPFCTVKFMFSKKATKIDKIFTVDLTVTTYCQIDVEDFVNFCGLLKKCEFYLILFPNIL